MTELDAVDTTRAADRAGYEVSYIRFAVLAVDAIYGELTLPERAALLRDLNDEMKTFKDVIAEIGTSVGEEMTEKRLTVEGVGVLERHRDMSRRNWQSDDLLRMALDSDRRPKDAATGEVESDLDVLRDVYGLKGYNARIGALLARGIDPDEFSEKEERGWRVVIR